MAGGWYYDSRDGNVALETGIAGLITDPFKHLGLGWHGPFGKLQGVVNFYNSNAARNRGWVPPQLGGYLSSNPGLTGVTPAMHGNPGAAQQLKNQVQGTTGAAGAAVSNPLDWLANIGQFFSALTQPNLWLRVSKVLLGGVLVVAGLIKLTGTDTKVYGLAGMAASKLPGV